MKISSFFYSKNEVHVAWNLIQRYSMQVVVMLYDSIEIVRKKNQWFDEKN